MKPLNNSGRPFKTIILFLCLFLYGCPAKENERVLKTATLKGPSAMAMIHMIENKAPIQGIRTSYQIKSEPGQVKAMILEESVDFAVLPSTAGALLYNKTGKYILAGIPVWGTLYLFGSDTTVTGWEDLRGKKVSLMARGMTPDIMFRFLAEKNGLRPEEIKTDYSFPGHIELANAIAAGISDLGVISEPLVSLVMAKNKNVKPLIDFNKEWSSLFGPEIPFAQTALLVHKDLVREQPEIVNEYLNLLSESINMTNSNPAAASHLIVKHEILPDTAVALAAIPRSNLHLSRAGEEMHGIEEYLKVFYNFNPLIIGGKLPDEEFYFGKKIN